MTLKRLLFNKITFILVLIAIAAGGWMLWQSRGAEIKYRTAEAKTADITQAVSANGTLVPARIVWTRFCNSGGLWNGISLTSFKG